MTRLSFALGALPLFLVIAAFTGQSDPQPIRSGHGTNPPVQHLQSAPAAPAAVPTAKPRAVALVLYDTHQLVLDGTPILVVPDRYLPDLARIYGTNLVRLPKVVLPEP